MGQLLTNNAAADSPAQHDMGMEMTEAVGYVLTKSTDATPAMSSGSADQEEKVAAEVSIIGTIGQPRSNQVSPATYASSSPAVDHNSDCSIVEPAAKRVRMTPEKSVAAEAGVEITSATPQEATFATEAEDESLEVAHSPVPSCTLKDFLGMSRVRFLDKLTSKRRTTMCISAPKPEALDEKLLVGTTLMPCMTTLEEGCNQLTLLTKGIRASISVQEAELSLNNPPLFETMQLVEDEDLDLLKNHMKDLKNDSRQKAKTKWYIWRAQAIEIPISQSLAARKEMMMKDQVALAATKEALSDALDGASQMKSSLLTNIAKLKAQLLSDEDERTITTSKNESAAASDKHAAVVGRQQAVWAEQVNLDAKATALQQRNVELAALQKEADANVEKVSSPATAEEVKKERCHYDVTLGVQLWAPLEITPTKLSFSIMSQYRLALDMEEVAGAEPLAEGELRRVKAATLELPAPIAASEHLAHLFDSSHIDLSVGCQKVLEQYMALVVYADDIIRDIQTMTLFNTVELEHAAGQPLLIKLKYISYTRKARFQLIFSAMSAEQAAPTCRIEGTVPNLTNNNLQAIVGECPASVAGWMSTAQSKVQEFLSSP